MGSLLQALQLGLEVNTPLGQAYLIPRAKKDRNGRLSHHECNFQIGYQGLLDLCYRYGKYKTITAEVVYEGDYFDFRYGTKQFLDHRPEGWKKEAKPTHVWALYELENGGSRFVVWTWEKAMAHGEEFSDSFNKDKPWASPWLSSETSKEEMAKKSVLKTLLKYAPKSVEGLVEAALYSDGHAVIANKVDEGGNMRLSFDIAGQVAPQDAGAQEAGDADPGTNAEAAPPQSSPPPKSPPANQAGGGSPPQGKAAALFPSDEAADLDGGAEPPNFGG
jgi:recombination protein RecT